MNFDYSEEQKILQDSVLRLIASHEAGCSDDGGDLWTACAKLGLLAMGFDEGDGGLGMGPVETMIVMRAMGGGLCKLPYLASAVYGTELLKATASAEQKASLVPALLDGSAQLAVAHYEIGSRYRLDAVSTAAAEDGGAFVLTGRKALVLGGASASHLVVSARMPGGAGDHALGLFLVPRATEGVQLARRGTIDGRTADDLGLDSVRVPGNALLAGGPNALSALQLATDHATVACLNEAVGAMDELLSTTVDYLKTRRQFNVTIGSFQALQHRAVDMFIEVELAKSMALYATMQLSLPAEERHDALAMAKLHINRASRMVSEAAVQLHGAIGMTLESKAGRLFNRLAACQVMFGDSEFWLAGMLESTSSARAA